MIINIKEKIATVEGQKDYLSNNLYGYNSNDMTDFFSARLDNQIYDELIINKYQFRYTETRIFDTLLLSLNIPQKYLLKLYEVLKSETVFLNEFKKSSFYSEKTIKEQEKLAREYVTRYKYSLARNRNITKELFEEFKAERIFSVILNNTHLSNEDLMNYLKELKNLSNKDFKEVLMYVSSRKEKSEEILEFIFKNGTMGNVLQIIRETNGFQKLEKKFLELLISSSELNLTSKEKIIKELIDKGYNFNSNSKILIKKFFSKLYEKNYGQEPKKRATKELIFK